MHFDNLRTVDKAMLSKLHSLIIDITNLLDKYEYHHAIKNLQEFVWHELCDYYLEYVKYRLYGEDEKSKQAAQYTLFNILLNISKMLSPFIPHITEEIYQIFYPDPTNFIVKSTWPEPYTQWSNEKAVEKAEILNALMALIRQHKANNNLSMKTEIPKVVISTFADLTDVLDEIKQTGNIKEIEIKEGDLAIEFG